MWSACPSLSDTMVHGVSVLAAEQSELLWAGRQFPAGQPFIVTYSAQYQAQNSSIERA